MSSEGSTGARALASRRNGARSRGPKTAGGKARVARNALKHGLSARRLVLLEDENPAAFAALARTAQMALAPADDSQAELVARIASATWRARRADHLEAALLGQHARPVYEHERQEALGLGLMRDGNGPRALVTLMRYRGSVLAELFRGLGALQALQAQSQRADAGLGLLPSPAHEANPRNQARTIT